jgi:hypothetical protein
MPVLFASVDAIECIVIARVTPLFFAECATIVVVGSELFLGVVDVVGDVRHSGYTH